ncbi:3-demethylubiquinone-9 3-methyltransferase-domain-containing protein [Podospora conica]|nr:3-demethylubiquinone-9 3-methyltransferase-domain-containing protein [Schizothecium conicum]
MFDNLEITTCLWFDGQAEAAADYYVLVFANSQITHIQRYTESGREFHGHEPGTVLAVEYNLNGHRFVNLNGGPQMKHTGATSFMIMCDTQEEIDYYWEKLGDSGDEANQQCGWVSDKFGITWQVTPKMLLKMLASEDKEAAGRANLAMMHMKKLDIAALQKAFDG